MSRRYKTAYPDDEEIDPKKVGDDYWILSGLAVSAAMEVDNHIRGRNDEFPELSLLKESLHHLRTSNPDFSHKPVNPGMQLALMNVFNRKSGKEISSYQGIALEMKLFDDELGDVINNNSTTKRLETVRDFLCDLYSAFDARDDGGFGVCYLAAG